MSNLIRKFAVVFAALISAFVMNAGVTVENSIVVVGGLGANCIEDPGCVNRLHPDIPMAARAFPGQTILFPRRRPLG